MTDPPPPVCDVCDAFRAAIKALDTFEMTPAGVEVRRTVAGPWWDHQAAEHPDYLRAIQPHLAHDER